MTQFRSPLMPPLCDLRDFPRMMLDVGRLRRSSFNKTANDAVWRAGINLWMSAWHERPAGSLKDDDIELADAAGLGRDLKAWSKVKTAALRNWILCDDGRLYHPVVCEVALESWLEKLLLRISSGEGNKAQWGADFDRPTVEAEISEAANLLRNLNPSSKALVKLARRMSRSGPKTKRPDSHRESHRDNVGIPGDTPGDVPLGSQETETETRTRNKKEELRYEDAGARVLIAVDEVRHAQLASLETALLSAGGSGIASRAVAPGLASLAPILRLLEPGAGPPCDLELDVLPTIRRLASSKRSLARPITSWTYFTQAIVEARDERLSGAPAYTEQPHVDQPRGSSNAFSSSDPDSRRANTITRRRGWAEVIDAQAGVSVGEGMQPRGGFDPEANDTSGSRLS